MTDTPPPGAGADARVHGSPDALAGVSVTRLATPRPLDPGETEALLGAPAPAPRTVVIDASPLKPQLLSLLRWLMHGLGIWLISRGMAESREAALEPILTGLALSGGALAWSVLQKRLASLRVKLAARTDPDLVVLK